MTDFRALAVETSTTHASVAACNGESVQSIVLADNQASSRQVFAAIRDAAAGVGLRLADVQAVAYGCGPGGFTGVRVAASAAQGLAFSLDVPVCRVSSLAALASNVAGDAGTVAACVDARMGEAYLGVYAVQADTIKCIAADALVVPSGYSLAAHFPDALPAGNGWAAFPEMLVDPARAPVPDVWPDAQAVLHIARQQFAAGQTVAPADALPNYVRDNVTHS